MYSFRYHLASLTAVFLALGLGLVIGASLADGGALGEEQWAVISEIESRLGELREENARLTEERARYAATAAYHDEAWVQIGADWIGDALGDRHVTLFALQADAALAEGVKDLLRALGARVTPVLLADSTAVNADLADPLALYLMGQAVPPSAEALIAEGALAPAVLDPPDMVVILSGVSSPLTEPLTARLAQNGIRGAVGVTGQPARARSYGDWPVASYVDTPAGRIHLAWLVAEALRRDGTQS